MKTKIILIFAVAAAFLAGCYIDPASDQGGGIALQINAKDISPDHQGYTFRVKLFFDGHVTLRQYAYPDPYLYVWYTVDADLPPLPFNGRPYEEFPRNPDDLNGTITIEGILPGARYRLLIELFNRYSTDVEYLYEPMHYAGLSEPFEVIPGGNVDVNVTMDYYSSGS